MSKNATNNVFLIPSITPDDYGFCFVESPSYHDVMNSNYTVIKFMLPYELMDLLDHFNAPYRYIDDSIDTTHISVLRPIDNPDYVNVIFRKYSANGWKGNVSITTYKRAFITALKVALVTYLENAKFTDEEQDIMDCDLESNFYALPINSQMIDDIVFGSNE